MAICQKHSRFFKNDIEPDGCIYCTWERSIKAKKAYRANQREKKKYEKKVEVNGKKTSTQAQIKNYKQRCHQKFSEIIRTMYDNNGFSQCVISGKWKETFGGLMGIHCGHYFPKGKFWWLAYRFENAGPLSYDENINQRESIPAMRPWLVSIWGEDKIKKLEEDAMIKPKNSDKAGQLLWYKSEYKRLSNHLNQIKNH